MGGRLHAYLRLSAKLTVIYRPIMLQVLGDNLDPNSRAAHEGAMLQAVSPPPATPLPTSVPPPPPATWDRYRDEAGIVWNGKIDGSDFFFEDEPGDWKKYVTGDGRPWWHNDLSEEWFFEKSWQ